ncbi:MAG TPA: DUF1622 domain-containing protein [Flavitalea sp.]|nr:DUF1622 domain-containing protein [Flavitalea sp.]
MKALIENIKAGLNLWGELAEVLLNTASLLIIILGVGLSLVRSFRQRQREPGDHPLHTYFRKIFGGWLIVALEFQLAADIVGTIISPTTSHLIELGAIALIRTFLNYFLNKELREEVEAERMKKMKSEKQVEITPEH